MTSEAKPVIELDEGTVGDSKPCGDGEASVEDTVGACGDTSIAGDKGPDGDSRGTDGDKICVGDNTGTDGDKRPAGESTALVGAAGDNIDCKFGAVGDAMANGSYVAISCCGDASTGEPGVAPNAPCRALPRSGEASCGEP